MNDHHYLRDPHAISPLMAEHPELRLHGGSGLFNYLKPEVRQHYLALVSEVLQRYDVDGLELDWMRSAPIFLPEDTGNGGPLITAFMRQVRELTGAAAERLGHPVRLAVRVPATPEAACELGFDVVGWAREGLIDLLIPGHSGYPDVPVESWREALGDAGRNCLIMPGTDRSYSGVHGGPRHRISRQTMRGFTASMLDRGADGLYLFNHFMSVDWQLRHLTPEGERWHEVMGDLLRDAGNLEAAIGKPRLHVLTPAYASTHLPIAAPDDVSRVLPAALASPDPARLRLHTGPPPLTGQYLIRVGLARSADVDAVDLRAQLNGQPCRPVADLPQPAAAAEEAGSAVRMLQFEAPLAAIRRGDNEITLTLDNGGAQSIVWLAVLISPKPALRQGE